NIYIHNRAEFYIFEGGGLQVGPMARFEENKGADFILPGWLILGQSSQFIIGGHSTGEIDGNINLGNGANLTMGNLCTFNVNPNAQLSLLAGTAMQMGIGASFTLGNSTSLQVLSGQMTIGDRSVLLIDPNFTCLVRYSFTIPKQQSVEW